MYLMQYPIKQEMIKSEDNVEQLPVNEQQKPANSFLLVEAEEGSPNGGPQPSTSFQILEIIEKQQKQGEYSEPQLKECDKMLHQWRQIQRQSLTYKPEQNQTNPIRTQSSKLALQQQNDIFSKYLEEIHHFLKARFIYEQLISTIYALKLLDFNELENLEFLYLISFRAWCEINQAKATFEATTPTNKSPEISENIKQEQFREEEDPNISYLVDPIFKLSHKVQDSFNLYHKALNLKEKSFLSRLRNLKDYLFNFKEKSLRDKFLYGFEGVNFSAVEQIDYTSKYLERMNEKVGRRVRQGHKEKKVMCMLGMYKRILGIQLTKIDGFDDFEIYKQTLMNEWRENNPQLNEK